MSNMDNREAVNQIINQHALKAQQSAYDRDTCVLAILKAREALMTIPDDLDEQTFAKQVLQILDELFNRYHDSTGQYTSGRGVIGALRDDIYNIFAVKQSSQD